jgi:hypothetical protein
LNIVDMLCSMSIKPGHTMNLLGMTSVEGDYQGDQPLTPDRLQHLFRQTVDKLDVEKARLEVAPFIRDQRALEVWSRDFFKQIVKRVAYVD